MIGGGVTTPGAVLLAGLAALCTGAGVLALAVPEEVAVALAVAVPEAGVTGWATRTNGDLTGAAREALAGRLARADAVVVGPGVDDPAVARALVAAVAGRRHHRHRSYSGDEAGLLLDGPGAGVLPTPRWHAASGNRLAARIGRLGFLARELLEEIPVTMAQLEA